MNRILIARSILLAGLAGSALAATAQTEPPTDRQGQSQLTMAQAVTIAESRLNARVIRARLERDGDAGVYTLRMATPERQQVNVGVDAFSGRLLPAPQSDHD